MRPPRYQGERSESSLASAHIHWALAGRNVLNSTLERFSQRGVRRAVMAYTAGGRRLLDNRAEEYRRLARECLRLVSTVTREDSGRLLIEMARVWTRLASEQQTPLNPRIADTSRPVVQQQQQPQPKKRRE
jgi:hypothetical protein